MTVAVVGEALIDLIADDDGSYRPHAGGTNLVGSGVGEVQQRDIDCGFDFVGNTVHRVRADQQEFRTRSFDAARALREYLRRSAPVVLLLELLDLLEVNAHHGDRR